jgi:hypothetical protein
MATISSPFGRTPRNAGAGANTYKKGGVIKQGGGSNTLDPTKAINTFKKNTSMKKGGTTKVAGVMKSGGTKYQSKGAVTAVKAGAVAAAKAAMKALAARPMMKKIVKIKR